MSYFDWAFGAIFVAFWLLMFGNILKKVVHFTGWTTLAKTYPAQKFKISSVMSTGKSVWRLIPHAKIYQTVPMVTVESTQKIINSFLSGFPLPCHNILQLSMIREGLQMRMRFPLNLYCPAVQIPWNELEVLTDRTDPRRDSRFVKLAVKNTSVVLEIPPESLREARMWIAV